LGLDVHHSREMSCKSAPKERRKIMNKSKSTGKFQFQSGETTRDNDLQTFAQHSPSDKDQDSQCKLMLGLF
jgi:hypothetical protein